MKAAFDQFLETGDAAQGEEGMNLESVGGMFEEGGDEMGDPLMDALESAGYSVDPEKAERIRAILEENSEEEGMEGEEGGESAGVMPQGTL
jgi:hypothetical protein